MNELYLAGCIARDELPQDFNKALEHFIKSASFEGTYAIAELYEHGVPSVFGNERFEKDESKAIDYYLQAYSFNKELFEFKIDDYKPQESISTLTLDESNDLLAQAHALNPDALYQLALFYKCEATRDSAEKVISISSQESSERINACLIAAANLYHPHAAFLLLTEQVNPPKLSIEEKLKYSRIAADPTREQTSAESIASVTISLRGAGPVTTTLTLSRGIGQPSELYKKQDVLSNEIYGLFSSSTSYSSVGRAILPEKHKAHDATLTNVLGGESPRTPLSREELRKMRAERFESSGSLSPKSR